MLLKDKVAIVTGGAQGMGRAISLKYAEQGCSVVVVDLNHDRALATAEAVEKNGCPRYCGKDGHYRRCGSCPDGGKCHGDFRPDRYPGEQCRGGLPVPRVPAIPIPLPNRSGDRVVNLNLKGPFLVTMAVLKHMKQLAKGKIIFVSSMGAVNPAVSVLHYHSAKAGILGFAKNLAFELAPRNIHVNTIVPGPIETTFWDSLMPPGEGRDAFFKALAKKEVPMERMGRAEDIAGAALFLASGLSDYVTGQTICVAGGQPLLSHGAIFDVEGFLNSQNS